MTIEKKHRNGNGQTCLHELMANEILNGGEK